jgi:argininosuccinate synthase
VRAIQWLQSIAQPFAIGRDIHVGDTIIGIKGRVGFEAAAPLIIIKAHHLLEKHTLTKWQLYWKEQLSGWYGNWLHEGQMLDPTMRNIEKFLEDSQATVTGKVFVTLEPYRFTVTGIESEHDLMSSRFGSYGEMNSGWTGEDVKGFAKIFGNQTAIYHKINEAGNKIK